MAVPPAPKNLRWERLANNDLVLRWDASPGATSYGVRYKRGAQIENTPGTWWIGNQGWAGIRGTSFTARRFGSDWGFRFVAYATNRDGNSSYSTPTSVFYTTPKTMVNLRVAPNADLNRAVVSFRRVSYYQQGYQVERREVPSNEVTRFTVGNGVSGNAGNTFTDTGISGDVQYRARVFVGAEGASSRVYSTWTPWSATVFVGYLPPGKPLVFAYNQAAGSNAVIDFEHEPRDGTPQKGWEAQYRISGASTWQETSGTTARAFTLTGLAPGVWEVRVHTKGTATEFGPWSDVQTFRVVTRPTVTFTNPPSTFNGGRVTATWEYLQDEGLPQGAWEAELRQGSTTLEQLSGVGPGVAAAFQTDLVDDTAYSVRVRVQTNDVQSTWHSRSFTTHFIPPNAPSLEVEWDEVLGLHQINVQATSGGEPTVALTVERSTDDGLTWENLGDFVPESNFQDAGGRSAGETLYRVTAYSDLGAFTVTNLTVTADSGAIWVQDEQGAGVGLRYNPSFGDTTDYPHQETVFLDGETTPTVIADNPRAASRKLSLSANILPPDDVESASDRAKLSHVKRAEGALWLKLPNGEVMQGVLTSLSVEEQTGALATVNASFEETLP